MVEENRCRTTPKPQHNAFLSFALEHPTLLLSVVTALLFAIRCVAVSGGNQYTVTVLLSQTSLGDAVRGLLFPITVSLLWLASMITAIMAGIRAKRSWRESLALSMVSLFSSALSTYLLGLDIFTPVGIVVVLLFPVALFIPSLGVSFLFRGLPEGGFPISRETKILIASLVIPLFVLVWINGGLRSQSFWLPQERLVFKGEDPFTGYVLKANEDHLVILNDDPRIIIEKPKENLTERDFCYPENIGYEEVFKETGRDMVICP